MSVSSRVVVRHRRSVPRPLEAGRSTLLASGRGVATGWRAGALLLALLAALTLTVPANADVVTDWNAIAEAVSPRFGGPQPQTRGLAIVQVAVHDALNAIEPRLRPLYRARPCRPRRLSRRRGRSSGEAGPPGAVGPGAGLAGRSRPRSRPSRPPTTPPSARDRTMPLRRRASMRAWPRPTRSWPCARPTARARPSPLYVAPRPASTSPRRAGVPGRDHALLRRLGPRHAVRPPTRTQFRSSPAPSSI